MLSAEAPVSGGPHPLIIRATGQRAVKRSPLPAADTDRPEIWPQRTQL